MKIEIEKTNAVKEFKSFTVSFTAQTIEEARLLFHICNKSNLKNAIFAKNYYGDNYEKCAPDIPGGFNLIKNEIEKQGFKI